VTDDTIENQNSAEGMVDDPGQQIAEEISQPDLAGGVANAHPAEFPSAAPARGRARIPLERFADVNIEITAEIGRVTMPLGELLQLSEGAVIELDRSVTEPVDILAQGVRIARGDVVVIDDRFAIQIREIVNSDEQSSATEEILTA
jgi:flagellar motor switch protein FliN/FliY